MTVFDLWKPILATGIATHIYSTLAWTALPHHKPDWTKAPIEDQLQNLIVDQKVPAGQYMFPFAEGGKDAATEEFKQKQARCRGMLVTWAEPLSMGKSILQTLLWFFAAAFTIGYLASLGLAPGVGNGQVLQFVGTAGLLTHVAAHYPRVFWFRRKMAMEVLDGVLQAAVTAAIFTALWPSQ